MSFEHPLYLLLLIVPAVYALLRKTQKIKPISFTIGLGDWNGSLFVDSSSLAGVFWKLSSVLFFCGMLLLNIAVAGPGRVESYDIFGSGDPAVIFLVDVSPSMGAADMGDGKNRLDVARLLIKQFATARPGNAIGLAAVGSTAVLLVPPTASHDVVSARLDMLNPGELGSATALGDGIALCTAHLAQSSAGVIILITDGENNGGSISPKTAASLVLNHEQVLYIAGTGSHGEVPVDYTDAVTGKRYTGFLQSSFDETSLQQLASLGGGRYFAAANESALAAVLEKINQMHRSSPPVFTRTDFKSSATPFLVAALFCFASAWVLRRLFAGGIV